MESHDFTTAEELSARFDAGLTRAPAQAKMPPAGGSPKLQIMPDALLQPLLGSLSVMSLELRASLLAAHGKVSEAQSIFAKAAQEEKELGYRDVVTHGNGPQVGLLALMSDAYSENDAVPTRRSRNRD